MGTGKTTLVPLWPGTMARRMPPRAPRLPCQSYPVSSESWAQLIRHLDLYRIRHEDELIDLGWDERCTM